MSLKTDESIAGAKKRRGEEHARAAASYSRGKPPSSSSVYVKRSTKAKSAYGTNPYG